MAKGGSDPPARPARSSSSCTATLPRSSRRDYAYLGKVADGMDVVEKIEKLDENVDGSPRSGRYIERATISEGRRTRGVTFASAPDGVRIRIHHLGGTGPPLLCVHATGFHGRVWEPFVPRLREHFSVVSLDQRGHGDSDKPASGYDWHELRRRHPRGRRRARAARPCRHRTLGGRRCAGVRRDERPGTFSRLVLMDPVTPQPDIGRFMASRRQPDGGRRTPATRDLGLAPMQMVERLKKGSPLAGWRDDFLRAYVDLRDGTTRRRHVRAEVPSGGRGADLPDGWTARRLGPARAARASDVAAHGRRLADVVLTCERKKRCDRLRNGRGALVAGGHFFPMENPDETVDARSGVPYRRWLRRKRKRRRPSGRRPGDAAAADDRSVRSRPGVQGRRPSGRRDRPRGPSRARSTASSARTARASRRPC